MNSRRPAASFSISSFFMRPTYSAVIANLLARAWLVTWPRFTRESPPVSLANWSAETWPHAVSRFSFLEWFEGIVVSGEEGVAKPDERIYRILLERYGLEAPGTVFIDDNLRNCRAAAALGFDVIHHSGASALRDELERRGIIPPAPSE